MREDLVRGYRIDIWDSITGKWQSLCRRTARYELEDGAVVVEAVPEEESDGSPGCDKVARIPTSNAEAAISARSARLVDRLEPGRTAPRPRGQMPNDTVDTTPAQTEAEVPPGLKFKSRFKAVKGSLPRLRFGRTYWIRARAVDLAGNSLEPQTRTSDPRQPTDATRAYLRYEPIAAPVIALLVESASRSKSRLKASRWRASRSAASTTRRTLNVVATPQVGAPRAGAAARERARCRAARQARRRRQA